MNQPSELIVVGAGIAGLASALAAVRRGWKVTILEQHDQAQGASIQNFGLVFPLGVSANFLTKALESVEIWDECLLQAGIPFKKGCAVAVTSSEGEDVLAAFHNTADAALTTNLLTATEGQKLLPMLRTDKVRAVLHSETERVIDSRTALPRLTQWLQEHHGVRVINGADVVSVESGVVHLADRASHRADHIVYAGGAGMQTLFPDMYRELDISLCTLQMSRLSLSKSDIPDVGLATEASLIRYNSFADLSETRVLKEKILREQPEILRHGINPLATSCHAGELVIGDSHHYGRAPDLFQKTAVDELYINALTDVIHLHDAKVQERWLGVYAKSSTQHFVRREVMPGVWVLAVLNGLGMTLSFGMAENMVAGW